MVLLQSFFELIAWHWWIDTSTICHFGEHRFIVVQLQFLDRIPYPYTLFTPEHKQSLKTTTISKILTDIPCILDTISLMFLLLLSISWILDSVLVLLWILGMPIGVFSFPVFPWSFLRMFGIFLVFYQRNHVVWKQLKHMRCRQIGNHFFRTLFGGVL